MISLCTICYFLCICNDLKKKNLTGIITTASMGVFLFLTPCSTPQLFPLCSQVDLSNFILSSTCGSSTSPIARRMKFTFLNIFKDLPPPSPTHRSQLDLQSHSLAMPYIRTALPYSTSIRNIFFSFLKVLWMHFSRILLLLFLIPGYLSQHLPLLMLLHPARRVEAQNCLLWDSFPDYLSSPPELSQVL